MEDAITFPGLGITLDIQRVAFKIGNVSIYWYGILIAAGMLLAFLYASKRIKQFDITFDDLTDITLWGIIIGILSARLFYVLFYKQNGINPYFSDPLSMFKIWEGGLAIYGGIIGAFATVLVFSKIKKQNPLKYLDIASLGFLIGQSIGRWGNLINREAYGSVTNLPWRMVINQTTGVGYHPCFLYESLWCALGFVLLHFYSKRRKYTGEIFIMYAAWYSFARFFIEGLRTDSLMLGSVRISQMISALVFIMAVTTLIVMRIKLKAKNNETVEYNEVYSDIAKEIEEEESDLDNDEDVSKDDLADDDGVKVINVNDDDYEDEDGSSEDDGDSSKENIKDKEKK